MTLHYGDPDQYDDERAWADEMREPDPTRNELREWDANDQHEKRVEDEDPHPEHRPCFDIDEETQLALPVVRAQAERGETPTARALLAIVEALDGALELLDVRLVTRHDPPRRHPCCTCTDGIYSYGSVAAIRAGDTDAHCPIHGIENALRG